MHYRCRHCGRLVTEIYRYHFCPAWGRQLDVVENDAEFDKLPPVSQPTSAGEPAAETLEPGLQSSATPAEPPKPEPVIDLTARDLSPDLKKILVKLPKKALEPIPEPPAVVMENAVPHITAIDPRLI